HAGRVVRGVELDAHRERVLEAERVGERAGDEHPAPRDRENHVGAVAVAMDQLCEPTGPGAELLPGHHLALGGAHPAILTSAAASASTASAMSSSLECSSGEWLTPPFRLRTKSIPVRTPAVARIAASCPAPETSSGAPWAAAR